MNQRPLTLDELQVLVLWPKGSIGEVEERMAIAMLLALCHQHGFGRIPQMAEEIRDLWNYPEKLTQYHARKKEHFKLCGYDNPEIAVQPPPNPPNK